MPTPRTVTIKSSGGDYTTWAGVLASETLGLVAADRILTVEVYASATAVGAIDTTTFTTDATRTLTVVAPTGEYNTTGVYDSAKARISTDPGYGTGVVKVGNNQFVTFTHLQIRNTRALSGSPRGIRILEGGGGGTVTIDRCLVDCSGAQDGADNANGISLECTTACTIRLIEPIVTAYDYGIKETSYSSAAIVLLCYGATITGCKTQSAFLNNWDTSVTQRIKNMLVQQASGTNVVIATSGGTIENVTILTQDASSPTTSLRSKTVTFDASTLRVASSDTSAKDAGTDLSADSYMPLSTDFSAVTWTAPWDVGALQATATTSAVAVISSGYTQRGLR